jgi:hypothetical protein
VPLVIDLLKRLIVDDYSATLNTRTKEIRITNPHSELLIVHQLIPSGPGQHRCFLKYA